MSTPKKENIPPGGASSAQKATSTSPYPRHVRLPFDLSDHAVKIEGQVLGALRAVFPATTNIVVSASRAYIHFTVDKFPPTPWPLTVAGLPITIGDGSRGKGPLFPRSALGNPKIRICKDLDASTMPFSTRSFRNLADAVTRELFAQVPDLAVVEILVDAERTFHVILRDDVDIRSISPQLPGWIARSWTTYLHDKDMCRPKRRQAFRGVHPDPARGIMDNTPYDVLRPGIAVFSPISINSHETLTTTTGVMVQNSAGDRFMTAASHGIGQCQKLFQAQPLGGRREIGEAV
jgi:hypothetical protein